MSGDVLISSTGHVMLHEWDALCTSRKGEWQGIVGLK